MSERGREEGREGWGESESECACECVRENAGFHRGGRWTGLRVDEGAVFTCFARSMQGHGSFDGGLCGGIQSASVFIEEPLKKEAPIGAHGHVIQGRPGLRLRVCAVPVSQCAGEPWLGMEKVGPGQWPKPCCLLVLGCVRPLPYSVLYCPLCLEMSLPWLPRQWLVDLHRFCAN